MILTLILFAFLLYKIDLKELVFTFKTINFQLLLLSVPIVIVLLIIRSIKWKILLQHLDIDIFLRESLRVILIGMFYGMITPGKAGELIRAYYLKEKKAVVVPTIIWDKISDILILVVLSFLALLLLFKNTELIYVIIIMVALLFLGVYVITNKKIVNFFAHLFKVSNEIKNNYLISMSELIKPQLLIKIFILSFLYYGLTFVLAAVILFSLNPNLNLLLIFSLPIIVLVGNAPITISGLGLREFAAILTFETIGENTAYGFSFTILLFILVTFIPALLGYILIVRRRTNQQLNGLLSGSLEKWRFNKIEKWLRGENVLDLGCGTGNLYTRIPMTMHYTGIDAQQEAIDEAAELNRRGTFLKCELGNESLPLKKKFDTIIMSAVLEHLDQPEQVLKDLKKLLKKDGQLIITTPTKKAEKILKVGSRLGIFSTSALKDHKHPLFDKNQLLHLAKKNKYEIIFYDQFEFGLNQILVLR